MHVLFGGSFDPLHRGHTAMATAVQQALAAEQVFWLPTPGSPFKPALTAVEHRLALMQRLFDSEPSSQGWVISNAELTRPAPAYTIDTLRQWRQGLRPDEPLVFILGSDSWQQLARWRDWQQLSEYAHLVVVSRPGSSHDTPDGLAEWLKNRETESAKLLQSRPSGLVLHLHTPHYPISSTELRHRLRTGADCSNWLCQAQLDYIAEHQLYRPESAQSS